MPAASLTDDDLLTLRELCPHHALGRNWEHAAQHAGEPCPYQVAAAVLLGEPDPRQDVATWRIDLPFAKGKPPLSLNDRGMNPFAHANAVEKVKAITRTAVREAGVPELAQVHVELHYRPLDNRHRDEDNLVATLKPCIDALHQPDERSRWAGILPGDDPRYVSWSRPKIHRKVKGQVAATWLILRSYSALIDQPRPDAEQASLL